MLKLPIKQALPGELAALLRRPDCEKLLVLPREGEDAFPCSVPELALSPDGSLLLGLENEHSQLGRGLVRALWFQRPVTLWARADGVCAVLTLAPWRCHIAGPLFTRVLTQARDRDPEADYTCLWELYPQTGRLTEETPPVPRPIRCTLADQHHLDHISLHR